MAIVLPSQLDLPSHADETAGTSPSSSPPSLLPAAAAALALPDSPSACAASSSPLAPHSPSATAMAMDGVGVVGVEAGLADYLAPFALPPAAVTATHAAAGVRSRRARAPKGTSATAARDHHHAGRSITVTAASSSSSSPSASFSDWSRHALVPALVDFLSTPSRALPVALGLLSLSYLLLFSLRTHAILLLLSTGFALLLSSLLLSLRASGGLLSLLSPASRHMLLDYNLLELVKISWHSRTLQDVMALVIFPLSKDERRRIIQRLPARLAALLTRRGVVHLLPKPAKRIMGHASHRPATATAAAIATVSAAASASVPTGDSIPHSLLASVSQPNLFARDSDAEAPDGGGGGDSFLVPGPSRLSRAPSRSPTGTPGFGPTASPSLGSTRARRSMSTGCLPQAEEQADAEAALSQLDDELRTQAQLQSQSARQKRAAEREKRRSARREERQRERAARTSASASSSASAERKEDSEEEEDASDDSSADSDDMPEEHVEWRMRRSFRRSQQQQHHQHDHSSAFSTSSSSSASASSASSSSSSSSSDWSGSSTPDVRNYDECTPSPAHVYFGSPADTAAMVTASAAAAAYLPRPRINPSFTFPRVESSAAGAAPAASPSAASSLSSSSYRAPLSTFLPLPSSVDDLSFANLLDRQLRLQARDSLRNLWRALWAAANDEAKQQWAALRLRIPPALLPYCTPHHLRVLLPLGGALAATQLLAVSPRCRGMLLGGVRLGGDAIVLGTACAAAVTVYTELHATVDTRTSAAAAAPSPSPSPSPSVGPLRSPSLASSARVAVSAPPAPGSASLSVSSSLLPSFALYCRARALSPASSSSSPLLSRLHTARLLLAWLCLRYRASGPLRTATLVLVMWMAWITRRSAPMRGTRLALAGLVSRMMRRP